MTKKLLFEIDGFQVHEDTRYEVTDMPDKSAPSGYRAKGWTKIQGEGISESFHVGRINKNWDTGFHKYSPCYANIDQKEADTQAKLRAKNVLDPYRKKTGIMKAFAHEDNDTFFDEKNFEVYSGQILKTSNPEDVMTLYFGLMTQHLAPDNNKGNPRYKETAYIIKDVEKADRERDMGNNLQFEVTMEMGSLLKEDRKRALAIFTWIGFTVADTIQDSQLVNLLVEHIKDEKENISRCQELLRLISDTKNQVSLDKLHIYKKLKTEVMKGATVKKGKDGLIYYSDIMVGADLKSAADNLSKNTELADYKREILLG